MAVTSSVPVQPLLRPEATATSEFARPARAVSVSVIIPARDEALTLPGTLQSLLSQDYPGAMRVIVVDNGSTDGTPQVARRWMERFEAAGHELVVLQLEKGNKPAALNAGDAAATGACRIYLDADTELSPNCVSLIASMLSSGSGVALCCARMEIRPARSWVTRRYARVWAKLPWVRGDVIGAGLYAVSADGRQRWGEFPNLIADDGWAQAQFRRDERRVIHDATFFVRLPEGLRNLINVRTRWVRGNRQLAEHVDGDCGRAAYPLMGRLRSLLTAPLLWPDLPLYFLVNACALWRAKRRRDIGTSFWERGRPRQPTGE